MELKFYSFENFTISKYKDGWFLVNFNPFGQYLFNIESQELSKIPVYLNDNRLFEQLTKIFDNKQVIPKRTFTPDFFFKRKKVPRLMIFPTATCNLSCIYCHCNSNTLKGHIDNEVLYETIDKYIEFVRNSGKIRQGIELTFMGGGEPFVKFDIVRDVVYYVRKKEVKAKFKIVTNGTLGSDDDWNWLLSNKFDISISSDGPPEIQDAQRPFASNSKTSSILEDRLKYLSNEKAKINIRSTVIDPSAENINAICQYFKNFKCVKTHQLEPVSFAGRGFSLSEDDLSRFYSVFFENYSFYLYSNPSRFKSAWFKPFQKNDGFCGAVYHNAVVTHDGYVTLCTEVDSNSRNTEIGDQFIVSHIKDLNPFNSLKAQEFTTSHTLNMMDDCSNCIIKYKCGGGCYIKKIRDFSNKDNLFYDSFCKNVISLQLSYLIQVYENGIIKSSSTSSS